MSLFKQALVRAFEGCKTARERATLIEDLTGCTGAFVQVDNFYERRAEIHRDAVGEALERWLGDERDPGPPTTDEDAAELRRLFSKTTRVRDHSCDYDEYHQRWLSETSFTIGRWRADSSRRDLDVEITDLNLGDGYCIESLPQIPAKVRAAIGTSLGDAALAYYIYLVAFDRGPGAPDWDVGYR